MLTIISVLVVIGGVVLAHELGHFVFAKLTGMRVEIFSIGFPPKLFGKKIGETEYRISAIPLGGYVKVSGVVDESMDTEIKGEPWEFQSKNIVQKLLFISGGVLFNLLFAVFIFSILTGLSGIYEADNSPVIGEVMEKFPADSIGLIAGDRILAVNGIPTNSWNEITEIIHSYPDTIIRIKWERDGEVFEKEVHTLKNRILKGSKFVEVGLVGISPILHCKKATFFSAIGRGFENTFYWLKVTIISVELLITGQESIRNIGGPIFIAQLAGQTARTGGLSALVGLMAIININLGLINILPLPALDGGHFLITLIEGIKGKPLTTRTKLIIQQIGIAIIILLTILVFYNDISRLFR